LREYGSRVECGTAALSEQSAPGRSVSNCARHQVLRPPKRCGSIVRLIRAGGHRWVAQMARRRRSPSKSDFCYIAYQGQGGCVSSQTLGCAVSLAGLPLTRPLCQCWRAGCATEIAGIYHEIVVLRVVRAPLPRVPGRFSPRRSQQEVSAIGMACSCRVGLARAGVSCRTL